MTSAQLKELLAAQPFRPFILHLTAGRSLSVASPHYVAHAGGRTAVVMHSRDRFEVVDISHVASCEAVWPVPPPPGS